MTNFDFLKKVDKNLFDIIFDAEKLYKDEYFEQCISQTRRFGENICKNIMGTRCSTETTFDEMLATLKDKAHEIQEKEFIEDLYFLKKQGNTSVHSSSVKQDGILAMECLQRAFEVAINYAVYYLKQDSKILKLNYDIDLLVLGEKASLKEKYSKAKSQSKKKVLPKQSHSIKSKPKKKGYFKLLLIISSIISLIIIMILQFFA
jgi:hypothetical protein